jgi:2-hydroxy-3-oxopropionate reductase
MGGTGSTTDPVDNSCAAHGGGGWDHSAMVRALEKMANFEIGQNPSQA